MTIAGRGNLLDEVATVLKALGHPLRLQIVALLADGPIHVGAIAERLGAPPSIVSQQLAILRMHALVSAERSGGQAVYHVCEPRIFRLLHCMAGEDALGMDQPAREP